MLIDIELPATVESPIDENGIKTITSYKWGPNQELVKVTRKVQMEKVETPVLKRVLERVKDERRNSKRVDSHQAFLLVETRELQTLVARMYSVKWCW